MLFALNSNYSLIDPAVVQAAAAQDEEVTRGEVDVDRFEGNALNPGDDPEDDEDQETFPCGREMSDGSICDMEYKTLANLTRHIESKHESSGE